ncbi:MAG: hypothetical protein GY844_29550, partial [Bradyrhizobium sp.]|nr:hypothetical protein [Bradyrhizobium sp.]
MRIFVIASLMLLAVPAAAAPGDLSGPAAAHAVDALIASMNGYVDPQTGARVQALLRKERKRLSAIRDREALVREVNLLLADAHDQHLKIRIDTMDPKQAARSPEDEALLERHLAHGLMAVRRLPGNIGYLKLRYFAADAEGARMVDQAMHMLKDSGALIIDLRENTGGGGATDTRLLGHLSATPIPMAKIHWRKPDGSFVVEQRVADMPAGGPLYADRPVFVLMAKRTFSAAEGFAYDLQAARRATLVGEA